MEDYFTQSELKLISDALILAQESNYRAMRLTISEHAKDDMQVMAHTLSRLNTKVCNLMAEG